VRNLNGVVMKDSSGDIGFPGYNGMIGTNALAYTLDMQTHGVSVRGVTPSPRGSTPCCLVRRSTAGR